jgi:transcriptional regulator with XRE-family HTH domain
MLAANVRRLRVARHWSLSELARATGMSKATLSGIENGRGNPTVETLSALASALRLPVVELLGEPPVGEVRLARAAEREFSLRDRISYRPLDAVSCSGGLELGEIVLEARQLREVDAKAPGARASVCVLEGRLIAGPVERSTELGVGDYIAFPADVPHVYEAGRAPVRALLVSLVPQ